MKYAIDHKKDYLAIHIAISELDCDWTAGFFGSSPCNFFPRCIKNWAILKVISI